MRLFHSHSAITCAMQAMSIIGVDHSPQWIAFGIRNTLRTWRCAETKSVKDAHHNCGKSVSYILVSGGKPRDIRVQHDLRERHVFCYWTETRVVHTVAFYCRAWSAFAASKISDSNKYAWRHSVRSGWHDCRVVRLSMKTYNKIKCCEQWRNCVTIH